MAKTKFPGEMGALPRCVWANQLGWSHFFLNIFVIANIIDSCSTIRF